MFELIMAFLVFVGILAIHANWISPPAQREDLYIDRWRKRNSISVP